MSIDWSSFFGGFSFGCAFLAALTLWRESRDLGQPTGEPHGVE